MQRHNFNPPSHSDLKPRPHRPLLPPLQQRHGHLNDLIPQIIRHALPQPIQPRAPADAPPQNPIHDEMHRPDPRKLDPLDVVRGVPVVAQQLRQPRARQEAAQPGPRARRGVRAGHEEADVGVAGFVAAACEHDVAEAGGLRGAEGGEGRGGGGVVVFARGQRREVRWGCCAGCGGGGGGGEDVDGGVEGRLRVEGWIVGEVGAGEREALVHGMMEAGEVLHEEFAHRLREADVDAWVGGFRENAHVGRALELGSWIWLGVLPLEFKNVELVKDSSPL